MQAPPPVRTGRRWIALLVALLAGVLLAEFGLRTLLFSEHAAAQRWSERWRLRRAGLYTDPALDDDFWKLNRLFSLSGQPRPSRSSRTETKAEELRLAGPPTYDPRLGWRSPKILANYDHAHRDTLAGRRPLLLYGASYATHGFDLAVESSDLAPRYCLLGYAVGGFGIDQAYLLMKHSLQHFEGLDPIVVLGFVFNTDFDRAALSFRSWPKPRATLDERGRPVFEEQPVLTVDEYLEQNPIRIRSYLARTLLHEPLAEGERRSGPRQRAKEQLIESLVLEIDRELEARGIPYFYLLFSNQADTEVEGPSTWQEPFVLDLLEREGIQYELARPALRQAAKQNGEPLAEYFIPSGDPRQNHPTPRQVEILLEPLRQGLLQLDR